MSINRFFIRRIIAVFILLFFILILYSVFSKSPATSHFDQQTLISHESRYSVQPLELEDKKPIKLLLTLESYEHKEILSMNPLEMALLYDTDDNFVEPTHWEDTEKSDYKRQGILTFPGLTAEDKKVILSLFFSDEVQFTFTRP